MHVRLVSGHLCELVHVLVVAGEAVVDGRGEPGGEDGDVVGGVDVPHRDRGHELAGAGDVQGQQLTAPEGQDLLDRVEACELVLYEVQCGVGVGEAPAEGVV